MLSDSVMRELEEIEDPPLCSIEIRLAGGRVRIDQSYDVTSSGPPEAARDAFRVLWPEPQTLDVDKVQEIAALVKDLPAEVRVGDAVVVLESNAGMQPINDLIMNVTLLGGLSCYDVGVRAKKAVERHGRG